MVEAGARRKGQAMSLHGVPQHIVAPGRRPGQKQQHGALQPSAPPGETSFATQGSPVRPHLFTIGVAPGVVLILVI
eukprot:8883896-Alexandrium_andersonii.AAC.1